MREFIEWFRRGIALGAGIAVSLLLLTALTALIAQTVHVFQGGDLISAAQVNENFSNIKNAVAANETAINDNHTIAAPEGAIMAFFLNTCPAGWIPADGTGGAPDLRGVFVRGRNTFDGGVTAHNRDPNHFRTLGDYQADAFASHSHRIRLYGGGGPGSHNAVYVGGHNVWGSDTAEATGGAETRPRNVALIYCMRKD